MKKKVGRPPVLDAEKKGQILGLLALGCSHRIAAAYIGCSASTIRNTALRDPEFRRKLGRAENQAEVNYLRQIQKAAEKEQYWRAAAWVLEHRNPKDYALRQHKTINDQQLQMFLTQVAQTILSPIADREIRQKIIARLDALTAKLSRATSTEITET